MKCITVSELRANATRIVAAVEKSREEVLITKNGRPVVFIRSVSSDEFALKPGREAQHGKDQGAL
jgi:prevent-host-death family protein